MSYHYTYALMDLDKNMKNTSNRPSKIIYDSNSKKNLIAQANKSGSDNNSNNNSDNNSDNRKTINRQ